MQTTITFPTILTLTRLLCSIFVIPLVFVALLSSHHFIYSIYCLLFFLALSLTDFLDGYFARLLGQESALGRMLDPLADKCLLYSSLVTLVYLGKANYYWAIILIGREFFVMGLREIALSHHFTVHVSLIGKIKTVTQMAALSWIILNPYQERIWQAPVWNGIELILILTALCFTLLSAYYYIRSFLDRWYRIINK